MKLFLLLVATTILSITFATEHPEICMEECREGDSVIGEMSVTADNLNTVCMEAQTKFGRDYNECFNAMTQALALGEDEAANQYCEFICHFYYY
mmetsp:Transcript_4654/g.6743  ORF Transcript_4654/g.6743 Transcript_4654/m.6743 type:complete len:94 (+) Transcript_4654:78-359(+)